MSQLNEQFIKLKQINKFTVFYGLETFSQHHNIDFEMFKKKLLENIGCDIYEPEDVEELSYDEYTELNSEVISNQFIVRGMFVEKYINNLVKYILLNETSYNLIPKKNK